MSPRAVFVLLAVVGALFVAALVAGSRREGQPASVVPAWTSTVGAWLERRQGVSEADLRPWNAGAPADVSCRDALAQRQPVTLLTNGTCAVFVAGSSTPVRSLVLRLEAGVGVTVEIDWVDRDDRLTETRPFRPAQGEEIRLPFYEEGGSLRLTCPSGCTLRVVTPGSA